MGWNFTQSLGDIAGKQCGLRCQPEVKVLIGCPLALCAHGTGLGRNMIGARLVKEDTL